MSSETQPVRDAGTQRETDVYDVLAWLEVNKKRVAAVALVLVLIGFAIATMNHLRQAKETKASGALLGLKVVLTPGTNSPPVQPTELLKVAENYSGTKAAQRARYLAATAFFMDGRYAEAEKEFNQFVKDHPDSPWVADAAYGIATSQEAQNKVTEALSSYQNVVTAHAGSPLVDDAKLALARIYETQKKPDQALRLYNELLAPRPGAQPGDMGNPNAFERKEALLRVHPELNTNIAARPLPAVTTLTGTTTVTSASVSNSAAAATTNSPAAE